MLNSVTTSTMFQQQIQVDSLQHSELERISHPAVSQRRDTERNALFPPVKFTSTPVEGSLAQFLSYLPYLPPVLFAGTSILHGMQMFSAAIYTDVNTQR